MKLFLVVVDSYDYEEYDSFVVRAEDEENALMVCNEEAWTKDNTTITEIKTKGKEKIILGSYNAG
jgi:hypothetical protein